MTVSLSVLLPLPLTLSPSLSISPCFDILDCPIVRKLYKGSSIPSHGLVQSFASPSVKKTNILVQDVSRTPSISISNHILHVVETFTHFGSTATTNLSLDAELNIGIGKASATMSPSGNEGLGQHQDDCPYQADCPY